MVNRPLYILHIWPRSTVYYYLGVPLDNFGYVVRILYGTLGEIYYWCIIFTLGL